MKRRSVVSASSIKRAFLPITTALIIFATFCFTSYNVSDSLLQSFSIFPDNGCNIFRGSWVPFPEGPYYTNNTECDIEDRQNCLKFGRPDSEFMKWRWKPDRCELPLFNASEFLEIVRGKTLAFVGDSVARNQMQSLKCLLTGAAKPVKILDGPIGRWIYKDYNFTIMAFWSPHLLKARDLDPDSVSPDSFMKMYVDEPDRLWADEVIDADIVIFSAGQWFYRPFLYYDKNGRLIGCHRCNETNITRHDNYYGYGVAFRTAFEALVGHERFKGMVVLRTYSPAHFENGEWNDGGNCVRTRPFGARDRKGKLKDYELEMYRTQVREYKAAERRGSRRGLKFGLLDTSAVMAMRPDGHPNHYGHWPHENKTTADCVHWCMPGPIDTWNEFLLQLLKAKL